MYLKWKCFNCEDVVISNSNRHHQMDFCKCGITGVDLEEDYQRVQGEIINLGSYDYDFFREIGICMIEQGFLNPFKIGKKEYISLEDVIKIREIEDKILESLK